MEEEEIKLEKYRKTSIYDIWRSELKELEDKYSEWLKKN